MGLLDGLLGGFVGGEMASVVTNLIEKHGGVQGIVAHLQQKGLGETAKSWVGTDTNLPISASQVHEAFGADTIQQLAAKAGLDPQALAHRLALLLPQAIDHLTPGGTIPRAS